MTQIPRILGARWNQQKDQRPTLPFYFVPSEGLLSPRSGQPVTFARASRQTTADAQGRLYEVPNHQPATVMFDLDGDGVRETAGLLLGGVSNQYGRWTNDLANAVWTILNTGSKTLYGVHGDLQLWRLLDSDAAQPAALVQVLDGSATADGQGFTLGIVVARDPTAPPTGPGRMRLRDTTASANRGEFTWTFDGAGVPTFAAGAGTELLCGANGHFLGVGPGGSRLYLQMAVAVGLGYVKANANQVEVAVSTTAAETGKALIVGAVSGPLGGFMAWPFFNRGTPSGSPAPETWTVPFEATPQAMTVYARYVLMGAKSVAKVYLRIYGAGTSKLELGHNGTGALIKHVVGAAEVTSTAPADASIFGSLLEAVGVLKADGSVVAYSRVNNGVVTAGAPSAALPLAAPGAWASLRLGGDGTFGDVSAYGAVLGAAVAWGEQTLDYMAGFFG